MVAFFRGGARCNRARRENGGLNIDVVLVMDYLMHIFEALRAPSERAENKDGCNEAGSGAFRLTSRVSEVRAPLETLAFLGRSNLAKPEADRTGGRSGYAAVRRWPRCPKV